ncbi:hypothetical protein GW17_00012463 [Ensete ventricosum]|nr:hypothetical protein GW17_00012463 [Ensete ventricosum]
MIQRLKPLRHQYSNLELSMVRLLDPYRCIDRWHGSIAISIEFGFQLFYGQSLTFTVALSLSSLKPFALSLDSTTVRPFLVASDRGVLASASRRVGLGRIPTAPPFSVLVAYIIKKGRIPTAPTPLIENLAVHLLDGVSSSRCRLQEGRASAASL